MNSDFQVISNFLEDFGPEIAGRSAEALVEAITRCGGLLVEYEVERRPDDEDELPDAPRIRER